MNACPPGAPCHTKNSQQLRDANYRYELERDAHLQLRERFDNLTKAYVALNQQHNLVVEQSRNGHAAYRELESKYRKSQDDLNRARRDYQHLNQFLGQERGRLDARLDCVLQTAGVLTQSLCSFLVDRPPDCSAEDKQVLKGECEALKAALAKQREMHTFQAFGGGRMPWCPP